MRRLAALHCTTHSDTRLMYKRRVVHRTPAKKASYCPVLHATPTSLAIRNDAITIRIETVTGRIGGSTAH